MEGRAPGAKYVWIPDRRSAFGVASLVRNDGKVRRNSTRPKAHLEPSPGSPFPDYYHCSTLRHEKGAVEPPLESLDRNLQPAQAVC
ncbi:hypothetical protein Q675_01910 [Labrenzia sp. C1B70]|nr:hypothetical protein Q675_01910 [Labrenzia sp. C1B70]